MSSPIELIAIITPKKGKADRVVELLNEVALFVKNNEPTTLKYQIVRSFNKEIGAEEIIMLEAYKDKAAIGAHGSSKEFQAFQKKLQKEDLVDGPMKLKIHKPAGGFSRL